MSIPCPRHPQADAMEAYLRMGGAVQIWIEESRKGARAQIEVPGIGSVTGPWSKHEAQHTLAWEALGHALFGPERFSLHQADLLLDARERYLGCR